MASFKLTRAQTDELRCLAQGRDHCERPGRNSTRDVLSQLGLIVWWVDPHPTSERNETRWLVTGAGWQQYMGK